MFGKVVRKLDLQGRITIPEGLLDLAKIKKNTKIYLCQLNEGGIVLKEEANIKGQRVVGVISLSEKGRCLIPGYLRGKDPLLIEMFILNGELILKEAD